MNAENPFFLEKMLKKSFLISSGGKGDLGKSGVTVQFKETSFLLRTKRSFSFELLDLVTDNLHKRVVAQEHKEIAQLNTCFSTMQE